MKVSLISLIAIIGLSSSVDAQIMPDSSLPQNSQVITLPTSTLINLGTERGSNLFHSFREFNVNDQQTVIFNNNSHITDIFTRVTGTNASLINGTISARGAANLFLINPNGIILGNNARLFIGGSFFGTTASQINFQDGSAFNAVKPEKSLLSISRPVGFLFEPSLNGSIQVNNIGHDLVLVGSAFTQRIENRLGLFVQPNQTLALIGNGFI